MTIEYATTPDSWPKPGRGGFKRNRADKAIISHPDGGKRTVECTGASSYWRLDPPYVDPPHVPVNYYADRGTHLHDISARACRGEALDADFLAVGEKLDIPAALQQRIYDQWIAFRARNGITTVAIEQAWVRDDLKVVSNFDRIDDHNGTIVSADIKSSSNACRVGYLVQAALGAHESTLPYDTEFDKRGEWHQRPRSDVSYIYWYRLNAACNGEDVDWQLIILDLALGHQLVEQVAALAATSADEAFTIVPVPSASSPADVELDDTEGDDARHVASPSADHITVTPWAPQTSSDITSIAMSSVIAISYVSSVDPVHVGSNSPPIATSNPTDRREALLARYANLTPADVAVFAMPDDRTDLDAIEAELDRVESFADVSVAPVAHVAPVLVEVTPPPYEGDDCTADDVAKAGARYTALDAAAKSWVTEAGAKVRLNPGSGGVASVRRRDILTGLLEMAEGKRDVDDLVRALLAHILGDIVWQGATLADTLAALTVDEARQFAGLAALVGMTGQPFDFSIADRVALTPDVVARAAA